MACQYPLSRCVPPRSALWLGITDLKSVAIVDFLVLLLLRDLLLSCPLRSRSLGLRGIVEAIYLKEKSSRLYKRKPMKIERRFSYKDSHGARTE